MSEATKAITIMLTDDEHARLVALAETRTLHASKTRNPRKFTPEDCLVEFVRVCQPDGNGWQPWGRRR